MGMELMWVCAIAPEEFCKTVTQLCLAENKSIGLSENVFKLSLHIDLGTVWISYFDEKKARELLHLPDNWQPICMLYIGYPAEDFLPNNHLGGHRKPLSETCFYNDIPDGQR